MSHLNLRFPPELLSLDNAMEAYMEEFRRKNLHVVPPHKEQEKPRILPAEEPLQMLSEEESKLPKWARAWLKVAKGIIG